MTPQPLDPRKSPWKRGDVCTLGFEKVGFVLSYTPEYLEIRWEGGIIEKRLAPEIEDILTKSGARGQLRSRRSPQDKFRTLEDN